MTDRGDYATATAQGTAHGGAERTVTAMYDTRGAAEAARDGLVSLGVPGADVVIRGAEGGSAAGGGGLGSRAGLGDLPVPDEDRHAYAEGLRRGGHLLSARVPEGLLDQALDVLERSGPVDLDGRSRGWSGEGWDREGYRVQGAATAGVGLGGGTTGATTGYAETTTTTGTTGGTSTGAGLGAARAREDGVVERAEERLRVGKREVGRGTVRVRSYVVETPVEERVTLREERVHVERRPVDRPVGPGDHVFEERVIEASERAEEAVVSKEARVVEEIGLRKEGDTRTETVRDTVRRQEVEVEDERTATGGGVDTARDRTAG
jgi:stress response protein YsnF